MGCNCTTSCPDYKRIQFRRDTAANWTSRNPPLAEGEFGYETDTGKAKIGTGKHYWKDLPYWPEVGDGGDSDSCAHIVSEVEPPPGTEIGDLWIDPTADTQAATIDVLAEIRGKVIAPKAIDLDGPNTLYIAQDADGSVKLSLRSDAKGSRLDNFFATEDWVLAIQRDSHAKPELLRQGQAGVGCHPSGRRH